MLDALSDFWKPMKKNQQSDKLQLDQLQIGSTIGFGFVPQPSLNGRRLSITEINTYKFGEEALTSFVLSGDKGTGFSMIVAESDDEQYLAISRRISIGDRMKIFDSKDLENISEDDEVTSLSCKEMIGDFKGLLVSSYKREIKGMAGHIFSGDFRKGALPDVSEAQSFKYTLLVSDSNEHAIEIEKYDDGRIEIYATIYRRTTDIGEITNPKRADLSRPDLKISSKENKKDKAETDPKSSLAIKMLEKTEAVSVSAIKKEEVKSEPIKLKELDEGKVVKTEKLEKESKKAEPKPEKKPIIEDIKQIKKPEGEKKIMATMEPMKNGINNGSAKSKFAEIASESLVKQESKPASNETLECDLKIANKIIDEAISNEMRLSDVVRRIVELPVSHQEAVQIPLSLSEEDYSLLAIRYGITANDHEAIKNRIMEDLTDFSGDK